MAKPVGGRHIRKLNRENRPVSQDEVDEFIWYNRAWEAAEIAHLDELDSLPRTADMRLYARQVIEAWQKLLKAAEQEQTQKPTARKPRRSP